MDSPRDEALPPVASGEAHLRDLFASIDEGYCLAEMVLDGDGLAVDYRFLEINPSFEEMTGLVGAAGRTALELVPDLEPVWVETYARVALGGEVMRFEQGSATMGRWFDVFAVPVPPHGRFALVFRDETARHEAQEALRESEVRARAMAEDLRRQHQFVTELNALLPGVLRVWDVRERRPVHVSGRTIDVVGRTPEEILALGESYMADHLHPDDVPVFAAHLQLLDHLPDGHTATVEYRLRHTDGAYRWLATRDVVLNRDGEGHVRQVLGIATDVTDSKRAEEALRQTAVVQAYRAHLGDTLRGLADAVQLQAAAARVLGEHLGVQRVHYAEIGGDGFGVVHADYTAGLPSVVGRHHLDTYGETLMAGLREGTPIVVKDVGRDARLTTPERAATAALGIGAYVMWPLVKEGSTVAALVVHADRPRDWSRQELTVVDETAERTWSSVHRARAEATLNRRSARAELVAELLSGLEGQDSVQAQLQRFAELLVPGFADFATVELPDGDETLLGIAHRDPELVEVLRELRLRHRLDPSDPNSVAHAALGRPQLIARLTPDLAERMVDNPQTAALLRRLANHSHMAVPLRLGRGVSGALVVGLSDPERPPYDEQALAFLEEAAQRAGVVLAAARLREEEHDVAVRLQRALLPDRLVWHPDVLIDARYEAANDLLEVGGDWYDSFSWPGGQVGVVVGDVVGHNLDSAATMGRLRAATSALATTLPPSPAALLEALEQFARGPDGTDFATAVCVVLDPATGVLTWSSAGHPPPVVGSPGRPTRRLSGAGAPPVCAVVSGPRPEASVQLEPGALVVLYSDGLVERRRETIDAGIARLEEAVTRCVADELAGAAVAERLVREVPAGAVEDDVVVACLRWTPVVATFEHRIVGDARQLAPLRRELRHWLAEQGIDERSAEDVLLCLGEACSNAVEHAHAGMGEAAAALAVVDVRLTHHGRHLTGRVRDHGVWRPTSRQDPFRGRGTGIMQQLSLRFDRTTGNEGTEVLVVLPVRSVRTDLAAVSG